MRICLINTYRRIGGAAVAAYRLKEALERSPGIEVDELYRFEREDGAVVDRLAAWGESSPVLDRLPAIEKFERGFVDGKTTERALSLFSLDPLFIDLAETLEVASADVINLHWVSFLQSPAAIRHLAQLGKPVVWTLHDERAFTGGCHYTSGCDGFTTNCRGCPQVEAEAAVVPEGLLAERLKLLRDVPLHFVSPSHWLGSQLRRSKLFNSACHTLDIIPYSVDLDRFHPLPVESGLFERRARLGLSPHEFCILAGSFTWDEDRKGGPFLEEAFKMLFSRLSDELPGVRVRVVTCGAKSPCKDAYPVHSVGLVESEFEMAELLQCCDLFVTMTREDNLPNMIIEALACGVPVLATAVGGIPEMVVEGKTGRLVPRDDSAAMAAALFDAVRDGNLTSEWSRNARRFAEENYAHALQASSYLGLFEKVLNGSRSGASAPTPPAPNLVMDYLYGGMAVELRQSRAELRKHRAELRKHRATLRTQQERIRKQQADLQACKEDRRRLESSFRYRLGSGLTWPARWILRRMKAHADQDKPEHEGN